MFFCFFYLKIYLSGVYFRNRTRGKTHIHFRNLPNLIWYLCKLVMSQHPTIEQYQIYKSTFIYSNIYKLQFIKSQYNSHCYTCPLQAKTETCNVDQKRTIFKYQVKMEDSQKLEQCKKFEMFFKHIETLKISKKVTKYDNTCQTLLL